MIAEGVETGEVLGFLARLSSPQRQGGLVQAAQGFRLGAPSELPVALPGVGSLR